MLSIVQVAVLSFDATHFVVSDWNIAALPQQENCMKVRRSTSAAFGASQGADADMSPIARLWALRLLVPLGAHKELLSEYGFRNEALSQALGMTTADEEGGDSRSLKERLAELRKLHLTAEKTSSGLNAPSLMQRNLARLAELLPLSDLDQRLLAFAVMLNSETMLEAVADGLGYISTTATYRTLSILLGASPADIRSALSARGPLVASGLIRFDRSSQDQLSRRLALLSGEFADQLLNSDADPIDLLRESVFLSNPPQLCEEDFTHVRPVLQILVPYLSEALSTRRQGVNVLLHGVPGTGKTQLARVLSQSLSSALFEVTSEDSEGDSVSGDRRLQAYRAAQCFLARQRAMILFDEVEDVFADPEPLLGRRNKSKTGKAWLNRTLEGNAVPALWISNSINSIDPAFIRRFDVVLELPVPPRPQRERILTKACGDFVDQSSIRRLADVEQLAPAVVARASEVVRSVRSSINPSQHAKAVELLISNTLRAQGHKPVSRRNVPGIADLYDPAFINADTDIEKLVQGLVKVRSGRLCLYGPPGTGKTAFARWLATQMGVPLIARKASDLMAMWLGETEKNVARAFQEAEEQGGILLIDEVDAFLRDRSQARQSWEHSVVTEMLTQMESFDGLFIASTNLMEGLDHASLRRFDLKAKFDYLKPAQARALLVRYCDQLSLTEPPAWLLNNLAQLNCLAPGDFAAVARRHRFQPFAKAEDLVFALEAGRSLRGGPKGPIGFTH